MENTQIEKKDDKDNEIELDEEIKELLNKGDVLTKGVIYLPRIPPFMTPAKFTKMFSEYSVERVYFAPIKGKKTSTAEQKKGSKAQLYKEGWAEFSDKRVAKSLVKMLNGNLIGGKKRHNNNRDDLWLMKYLPKFKWEYLTEKKMYQQKIREQKMRTEESKDKREINYYIEQTLKRKKVEEPPKKILS
jgi:ESF2/ABP1 family protein